MNRKEELQQLCAELEASVPSLEASLEKAKKRKQRRNLVLRPLGSVAAAFVLFVLLVNYCAPVAYACSKVPVLRELAEAVTFSRSLSAAVENDYVQEMNLVQTKNDITAEIAYLIVDQKQINVFYRLYSDKYQNLDADPDVLSADGSGAERCAWSSGSSAGQEQGLHHITIDYVDADVPDSLRLVLRVRDLGGWESHEEAPEQLVEDSFFDDPDPLPEYLEEFDFLLEFDPTFTETGKVIPLGREVLLGGQTIIPPPQTLLYQNTLSQGNIERIHHKYSAGVLGSSDHGTLVGAGKLGRKGDDDRIVSCGDHLLHGIGKLSGTHLTGGGKRIAFHQTLIEFPVAHIYTVEVFLGAEHHLQRQVNNALLFAFCRQKIGTGIHNKFYGHTDTPLVVSFRLAAILPREA